MQNCELCNTTDRLIDAIVLSKYNPRVPNRWDFIRKRYLCTRCAKLVFLDFDPDNLLTTVSAVEIAHYFTKMFENNEMDLITFCDAMLPTFTELFNGYLNNGNNNNLYKGYCTSFQLTAEETVLSPSWFREIKDYAYKKYNDVKDIKWKCVTTHQELFVAYLRARMNVYVMEKYID